MVVRISSRPLSTQAAVVGSSIGTWCVGGDQILAATVSPRPLLAAASPWSRWYS